MYHVSTLLPFDPNNTQQVCFVTIDSFFFFVVVVKTECLLRHLMIFPSHSSQLHRKRHIGNDIVNIVFQSEDAPPLNIDSFASKYTQVIIVVRVFNHGTPQLYYKCV